LYFTMLVSRRYFFFGSLALPLLASKKQAPPRPSILLILVDQLPAWTLGPYGNKEIQTHTIDRLAQTGTHFLNHFAASPDPASSRATLLTGRTPMQVGDAGTLSSADIPLDKLLSDLGYACQATGKGPGAEMTAAAVKFLDQQTTGKNFLLTVHYSDLHPPYDGTPKKFVDLYASEKFESYAQDKPAANAREGKEMLGDGIAALRKAAAAVSALDDQVGAVVAKLYQKQLVDNTLIVFTSTCGALFGRHGLWGSGLASDPVNMYDEVVNTPMIWSWPTRIPPQGMQVEMVSAYDLVPTLCEFVGTEPPDRNLCGRSYLVLATGKKPKMSKKEARKSAWRTTICGHWQNTDMAREEGYKVVLRDGGKGPNELYDLPEDRVEKVNQYDNPQYLDVKNRLTAQITNWKQKYSS
jgi:arylsulfatase A-like enzyme